jgi:hypothetical protein
MKLASSRSIDPVCEAAARRPASERPEVSTTICLPAARTCLAKAV